MQRVETKPETRVVSAPYLSSQVLPDRDSITKSMDAMPKHPLDQVCWDELQSTPEVKFAIAYSQQALLVKFFVRESDHLATYRQSNEPVFSDSCVEFFIAVDDSGYYYNFEFNSFGTCLASYGTDRNDRIKLDPKLIDTINCWPAWKTFSPETNTYEWELTFALPPSVLCYNDISRFTSGSFNINLYKCGDALKEPHHLSWNLISSPVMDFHQPAYFGSLQLQ